MEPGSLDDDAVAAQPKPTEEDVGQKDGEAAEATVEAEAGEEGEQSANAAEDKPLPWWKKRKEEAAKQPRARLGEGRCVGLVIEWRGHMGWIQPLTKINHEQAKRHRGRIYLAASDIVGANGAVLGPTSSAEAEATPETEEAPTNEDTSEQEKKDDKEDEKDAKE